MKLCTCNDTTPREPYNALPGHSPLRGMRCHTVRARRDCTNLATRDWCGVGGLSPFLLCDECSTVMEQHLASTRFQTLSDGEGDT